MNKVLVALFISISACAFGQNTDSNKFEIAADSSTIYLYSAGVDFQFIDECPYTVEKALVDIQQDSLKFVIQGGFTGFKPMDSVQVNNFQRKYHVKFEYLGCIRTWNVEHEDIDGYNQKILDHLSKLHGASTEIDLERIWQ